MSNFLLSENIFGEGKEFLKKYSNFKTQNHFNFSRSICRKKVAWWPQVESMEESSGLSGKCCFVAFPIAYLGGQLAMAPWSEKSANGVMETNENPWDFFLWMHQWPNISYEILKYATEPFHESYGNDTHLIINGYLASWHCSSRPFDRINPPSVPCR